jgi:hypothetical protein
MGIWYATREDVVSALGDVSVVARGATAVDRAIEAGSRSVEALTDRVFYPTAGSRTFQQVTGERLFLDSSEAITVTSITVDGVTVSPDSFVLSPNTGPPFTAVDFPDGPFLSYRGDLIITGVFGYTDQQEPAGALVGAIDAAATHLVVSDGSAVGVGTVLTAAGERMVVTGRSWTDTGQTVATPMTASAANTVLEVADGTGYSAGETLMVGGEQMLVTDITADTLIVRRAQQGTVLAPHTGSAVFASRSLQVARGQLGSTGVTHSDGAALTRLAIHGQVRALTVAEAINQLQQEGSGYAEQVGGSDATWPALGGGLGDARQACRVAVGRKGRVRSV